jgi:hypothetical protein
MCCAVFVNQINVYVHHATEYTTVRESLCDCIYVCCTSLAWRWYAEFDSLDTRTFVPIESDYAP